MKTYLVLFERDAHDEIFTSTTTHLQRFDQLRRELEPAGIAPGYLSAHLVEGRDIFLTALDHPGEWRDLRDALQLAYDHDGVDGLFQIAATCTNPEPLA